jgi:hypothetical protein
MAFSSCGSALRVLQILHPSLQAVQKLNHGCKFRNKVLALEVIDSESQSLHPHSHHEVMLFIADR